MFDNDQLSENSKHPFQNDPNLDISMPLQPRNHPTFRHLSKQQSISEIAPDTQRSHTGYNHNYRNSLEEDNLYGLVMMGSTAQNQRDHELQSDMNQLSGRGGLGHPINYSKQLTAMMNPVNNTTTDFFTEEDEVQHERYNRQSLLLMSLQQKPSNQRAYTPYERQEEDESEENRLIVWGRNQMGQLGVDPRQQQAIKFPLTLSFPQILGEVQQVSCGKAHTVLLVERNQRNFLYSFGSNKTGQLGIGKNIQFSVEPQLIEGLPSAKIDSIASAKNSSFVLFENGTLYSWGGNKEGILGIGSTQEQYRPVQVNLDSSQFVQKIALGKSHAGALVRRSSPLSPLSHEQICYLWGSNRYGQLGLSDFDPRLSPVEVSFITGAKDESFESLTISVRDQQPQGIACGDTFTLVNTSNHLYACGSNIQGQLGLGEECISSKVNVFTKLSFKIGSSKIEKIAASDFGSFLTNAGDLYLWGPTPLGQFSTPKLLQNALNQQEDKMIIQDISMGTSFGIIQDINLNSYQIGSLFHENNKNAYDSSKDCQTQNFYQIQGGTFDKFCCGNDFVVGVINQNGYAKQPHQAMYSRTSLMGQSNLRMSRSMNAVQKSFNNAEQSMDAYAHNLGTMKQAQTFATGRYANLRDQPSMCSSSLSPLRCSMIQMDHSGKRNDALNRSAIINISALKGTQNAGQLAMKPLRESSTPVREFLPPSTKNANPLPIFRTSGGDQSKFQNTPIHETSYIERDTMNEPSILNSHYQTIQDTDDLGHNPETRSFEPHFNKTPHPQQSQHSHPQPTASHPSSTKHRVLVPPFNLPAPTEHSHHHLIPTSTLDILIREKQELQHSLNVEIQRRLMLERDLNERARQEASTRAEAAVLVQRAEARAREAEEMAEQRRLEGEIARKAAEEEVSQVREEAEEARKARAEGHSQEVASLEEVAQRKGREIYDLTVKLGALKEENYQVKRDLEELKGQFEDRLKSQQERGKADYSQLLEEYQSYQMQQTKDSMQKRTQDDKDAKIKMLEDKVKRLQGINAQLKGGRSKKNSLRLDLAISGSGSIQVNESACDPLSHYTSIGAVKEEAQATRKSHDQSFHSIGSKKSKPKRDLSAKRERESISVTPTPQVPTPAHLEVVSQSVYNPIEAPNESQRPIAMDKKQAVTTRQTHNNLFKKHMFQVGNVPQPVLSQSTTIEPVPSFKQPVTTREVKTTYHQQENARKKSQGGVVSSIGSSSGPLTMVQSKNALRPNSSKINQQQLQTIQVVTSTKNPGVQKTPTRVLQKSETQCALKPVKSQKSPNSQYSSNIQRKIKQKSISSLVPEGVEGAGQSRNFQLNAEEGNSIFDLQVAISASSESLGKKRRPSQYHNNSVMVVKQEMTLGADEQVTTTNKKKTMRNLSPPETPQMPGGSSDVARNHDFSNTTQSFVVLEQAVNSGGRIESSSSSSTLGNGQVMTEMRSKLIDIQNNKQYIEQKIQEYERKLHQLKGANSHSLMSNYQIPASYYNQYPSNMHGTAGTGTLTKSSSGMIMINRDSGTARY